MPRGPTFIRRHGSLQPVQDTEAAAVATTFASVAAETDNGSDFRRIYVSPPASAVAGTISCWVAIENRGSPTFQQIVDGGADTSNHTFLRIRSSGDLLEFVHQDGGSSSMQADDETQDIETDNTWYHLVATWDTEQATSAERLSMWVNGNASTIAETNAVDDAALDWFASGVTTIIGDRVDGGTYYVNGHMAEFYYLDGVTAAASDFAFTDVDGKWRAKSYSDSMGTNGVYLNFSDTENRGNDQSANSNHFSPVGTPGYTAVSDLYAGNTIA